MNSYTFPGLDKETQKIIIRHTKYSLVFAPKHIIIARILAKKLIKSSTIILFILFSSCSSIRQARYERANRHIYNYKDLHGKYHTIIGILLVMMILILPSCKIYKTDKDGKQVETWNTRHLKRVHHSLIKNTFFVKNK